MIDLKYDMPIEVTKEQYWRVVNKFRMIVAHRRDVEGRYWVKLWVPEYRDRLERALTK